MVSVGYGIDWLRYRLVTVSVGYGIGWLWYRFVTVLVGYGIGWLQYRLVTLSVGYVIASFTLLLVLKYCLLTVSIVKSIACLMY